MANYFDGFCNKGNTYTNHLANKLCHPERKKNIKKRTTYNPK